MKVIYGIGQVKGHFKNVVLAIGVFDGVHRGHQQLIKKAIEKAKKIKGQSVVLTFFPHPVHVLHPDVKLPLIVPLDYRLKLLENLGVDICLVTHFTKPFSRLTPDQFIKRYLLKHLKPKEIFVGDDFRFGQDRTGTLDFFKAAGKKYGFHVNGIHPVKESKKEKISSSHIRELIAQGKLDEAKHFLGRNVSIMGKVERGDARGKSLGIPTANLYPGNEVIPPKGVYAARVLVEGKLFYGVSNIGYRPSFNTAHQRLNVEVHIFRFKRNIYGRNIVIEFIQKIRDERVFESTEKLVRQIKNDIKQAKAIFAQLK